MEPGQLFGVDGVRRSQCPPIGEAPLYQQLFNRKSDLCLLIKMCAPWIVIGVIANIFVLWIWLTIKSAFSPVVYLFKALAVADLIFLSTVFPSYFSALKFHESLFFRIVCNGNMTIGTYITLLLAVARFIETFFPLRARRLLSLNRVRLILGCFILALMTCQTIFMSRRLFIPQKYLHPIETYFNKILLTGLPVSVQNLVMIVVGCKLWKVSRTVGYSTASVPQANRYGVQVGLLSDRRGSGHRTVTQSPTPLRRSAEATEGEVEAQPPQYRETEAGITKVNREGLRVDTKTMSYEDSDAISAEDQRTCASLASDMVSPGHTPGYDGRGFLMTRKEVQISPAPYSRDTLTTHQHLQEKSGRKRSRLLSVPGIRKQVYSRPVREFDARTACIIFSICFMTFIVYMICGSIMNLYYRTADAKSALPTYLCLVARLVNSSINVVFYACIGSFRAAFRVKRRKIADSIMSSNFGQRFFTRSNK